MTNKDWAVRLETMADTMLRQGAALSVIAGCGCYAVSVLARDQARRDDRDALEKIREAQYQAGKVPGVPG